MSAKTAYYWGPPLLGRLGLRVRIPAKLAIRAYTRAVAKQLLTDDLLGFYVCPDPACKECQEIAARNPRCGYSS
jgi:hypothetical protein